MMIVAIINTVITLCEHPHTLFKWLDKRTLHPIHATAIMIIIIITIVIIIMIIIIIVIIITIFQCYLLFQISSTYHRRDIDLKRRCELQEKERLHWGRRSEWWWRWWWGERTYSKGEREMIFLYLTTG